MSEQRRLLVAGNWKMNGASAMIREFCAGLGAVAGVEMVLLPPAVYLRDLAEQLQGTGVGCGVQDVHEAESGAYTGDIAAGMAAEVGAGWAVVGHSERREYHGEDDAAVGRKLMAAQDAGLQPILCVGESLAEREAGNAESVVGGQIARVADTVGAERLSRAIVAYEPIWAIGTGVTATPEQANEMHAVIRERLDGVDVPGAATTLLYGGSVNADNAATLFAGEHIDGGLVGGASLKRDSFMAIAGALAAAKAAG